MRKKLLAMAMAVVMLGSSGIMASANPAYDTDYKFKLGALGTSVASSPTIHKLPGTTRAWIMQYSISGAPTNTVTNMIVVKPNGDPISPDTPITKGQSIFTGYNRNGQNYVSYTGGSLLLANPTYTPNYTITGTWNPNIN